MFLEATPEAEATGDLASWYDGQRKAWGYLPNYAQIFSTRPQVAHAWSNLNLTIRGGMDRRLFELATVAASRALACTYCLAAHSTFLRDVVGDEATTQALAEDPTGAGLGPADAAVVAFATKVATDAPAVTEKDVQRLLDAGFTRGDVADVIFAVGARAFFATVLDAAGALADSQLAETLGPEVTEQVAVGRPFAAGPTDDQGGPKRT
jgi:uncharacterized peroxidase-related enzyme